MMLRLPLLMAVVLAAGPVLADPLPSWNDGAAKSAIVDFVAAVTDPETDTFVPVADRIAVFDNDGTLMAEQPIYFQAQYAFERLREKAADDPSILTSDVLRAADAGDLKGVMAGGAEGLSEIINVSHSDVTIERFQTDARNWFDTARHPTTGLPYRAMTYQPMVELLRFLRDEDFEVYVVTAGGTDFVRSFALDAYNVPPQNVVGSLSTAEYREREAGGPMVVKADGVFFFDDGAEKPVAIMRNIGKRPILAGGNSDGDFEMIEWTTAGGGPRLGLIVHHTDGEREFAYDREGPVGRLDRGLDAADANGWVLVDMAQDWARIWTR